MDCQMMESPRARGSPQLGPTDGSFWLAFQDRLELHDGEVDQRFDRFRREQGGVLERGGRVGVATCQCQGDPVLLLGERMVRVAGILALERLQGGEQVVRIVGQSSEVDRVAGVALRRLRKTSDGAGIRLGRKHDPVSRFGGFVVLRKEAVLAAGNWDPCVFGNEELELHSRLGDGRKMVRFVDEVFIRHYDDSEGRLTIAGREALGR